MWCIAELDLPYKRIDVGHVFGGTDTAAFLAMNPNGTVPVLQDGSGPPIWETGCILRYLAGRYGQDSFWPADVQRRTNVDQWAEWAKLNVALDFTVPVFWRVVRTAKADQDPVVIEQAVHQLEANLAIANARLSGQRYLAGDMFSLADIQFGHVLYRYYDIDIRRAKLPALAAYYTRLTNRPAFQDHVMVSYDDLRVE